MDNINKNIMGTMLIFLSVAWLFFIPFIPLEGSKQIKAEFITNQGKYTIVFFGYPGCGTICPSTMKVLSDVYTKYQKKYKDNLLEIAFVNLQFHQKPAITIDYAKNFHKDFMAYQLSEKQLNNIMKQWSVYSVQKNGQIVDHTGYIYLLEKKQSYQWVIKYVYSQQRLLTSNILNDLKKLKKNEPNLL